MKFRYNIFCMFLSLLMMNNYNIHGTEIPEDSISDNNNNVYTSYGIKALLLSPFIIFPLGYWTYNKIKNKNGKPDPNQLKPLYIKKLNNKITLRIIKHGTTSTGLLVANTKDDPYVIKDSNGNNLTTAIVSPNNQACRDGALAGAIEKNGGKDVKDDKQKWIQEGIENNFGTDDYTGNPIAIKYGNSKLGRAGNFKHLKNIIHTVGPYVPSGNPTQEQKTQLKNSYVNSCNLAAKNGIKRIIFPPISLGVFNFPRDKGVEIPLESIKSFSNGDVGDLEYIDIWMINDGNNYPFVERASKILGPSD